MISSKPYLFRAIYQWLVDSDLTPYVMVDATLPHVAVPEQHIEDGQIILDMAPEAVIDLTMGNSSVDFKARFSGVTHHILLPMNSILALYAFENGRGMVFSDEDEDDGEGGDEPPPASDGPASDGRSHLKVVK